MSISPRLKIINLLTTQNTTQKKKNLNPLLPSAA